MFSRLRIVIADDDRRICDFFRLAVQQAGHDVVGVAHDGCELIRLCNDLHPDLVITDVKMPHMDGIEAVDEICAELPMPVILVSSYSNSDLVKTSMGTHVVACLSKPVKADDLETALALAEKNVSAS